MSWPPGTIEVDPQHVESWPIELAFGEPLCAVPRRRLIGSTICYAPIFPAGFDRRHLTVGVLRAGITIHIRSHHSAGGSFWRPA